MTGENLTSKPCFWKQCSDRKRCEAFGSCVALAQAGGATFPQSMEPNNAPLSHLEILSAVSHHAREIARLTEMVPVQCSSDEPKAPTALCSECGEPLLPSGNCSSVLRGAVRNAQPPSTPHHNPVAAVELLRKWREEARSMTPEESAAYRAFIDEFFVDPQPPTAALAGEYIALIDAFIDWWLDHHEDSRFFNEAVQASPALAAAMNAVTKNAPYVMKPSEEAAMFKAVKARAIDGGALAAQVIAEADERRAHEKSAPLNAAEAETVGRLAGIAAQVVADETSVRYCKCAFIDPDGTVVPGEPCPIHGEPNG